MLTDLNADYLEPISKRQEDWHHCRSGGEQITLNQFWGTQRYLFQSAEPANTQPESTQ
ncbi:hypothetical protein ALQ93_01285 [Pseudomonas syringae pv. pisi]|uniref:Uncharacterized protein n=4 Tax=Pseudomonas syringae group TaxID=136849 RepID=F3G4T7_PSESJ|nr:hypothetical protein PSYPI_06583 [Pseudomonas syringae pv. pisi str. 1704B]RML54904.1 hypothetical protein ALQ93_01285 [Pseudomonas syringae pv. pisi]RMU75568.1 hypothetical protein ALP24_02590 [Pseudomonas syringae pv. aptata]RMU85383.1 hypothetical protein ALP21_03220 [Pseudomonas savastanoi pv. phaseolicola]RML58943.1 hypothetical protein ALQ92_01040 [Pseudomonas syringae pv. pisi]